MSNVIDYEDVISMMVSQFFVSQQEGYELSDKFHWRLEKLAQWEDYGREKRGAVSNV